MVLSSPMNGEVANCKSRAGGPCQRLGWRQAGAARWDRAPAPCLHSPRVPGLIPAWCPLYTASFVAVCAAASGHVSLLPQLICGRVLCCQAGLTLVTHLDLTLSSCLSCFCLPSSGIPGVNHHASIDPRILQHCVRFCH